MGISPKTLARSVKDNQTFWQYVTSTKLPLIKHPLVSLITDEDSRSVAETSDCFL